MGQVKGHEWIQPALQEDIVSEMNKTGLVQTHSMADPLVSSDADRAIAAGKDAGADLVIFGSYQIVGDQIRVNGQMTQVSTGAVVAPLQATGMVLDIFKLEDTLASQLQPTVARLYAPQRNEPVVTYGGQSDQYVSNQVAVPQSVAVQPSPDYYTAPSTVYVPSYPYGYDYGYYPGVYFGGGFYYGGRFNRGFGTFNHGFIRGGGGRAFGGGRGGRR
jgi:TolB-like protein